MKKKENDIITLITTFRDILETSEIWLKNSDNYKNIDKNIKKI